jgi:FeS assembly SUF system protein
MRWAGVGGRPALEGDRVRERGSEPHRKAILSRGLERMMSEPMTVPTAADAAPAAPAASGARAQTEEKIRQNLKKVYDPEIPMNIVDLGLIYEMIWADDQTVTIKMTLTAPGCPVAGILADEVKAAAQSVEGVREANIDMVWEPPWTPERMSDLAKRTFGYV